MFTNLLVAALVCIFIYLLFVCGWTIVGTILALIFRGLLKIGFFNMISYGIWGAIIGAGVFFLFGGYSLAAASTGAVLGAIVGAIWSVVRNIARAI